MSDPEGHPDTSEVPVDQALALEVFTDQDAPEHGLVAWIESLGPGGDERVAVVGELMTGIGPLFVAAADAAKAGAIAPLEDLDRRAKVFAARADASGFDWASEVVRGSQKAIAALLHGARGNQCVSVWRHAQAKREFGAAIAGLTESMELFSSALPKFPPLSIFAQVRIPFSQAIHMLQQTVPMMIALEKNSNIDELLLHGRVREYLVGVRGLAGELRRMSDGVLGAGSDAPELLAISGGVGALADTLVQRAEAIEEAYESRDLYLPPTGDMVFIVHGHAEDKWRELRDLLEDDLGLKGRVIVLKEEASQSMTVIEKFEERANQCCYGFALVTPDDEVKKQDAPYRQARPNVLFEVGWFYGRFGPRRLCILKRTGTEIPSDLSGVVTLEFDRSVDEQLRRIRQELKAAGVV